MQIPNPPKRKTRLRWSRWIWEKKIGKEEKTTPMFSSQGFPSIPYELQEPTTTRALHELRCSIDADCYAFPNALVWEERKLVETAFIYSTGLGFEPYCLRTEFHVGGVLLIYSSFHRDHILRGWFGFRSLLPEFQSLDQERQTLMTLNEANAQRLRSEFALLQGSVEKWRTIFQNYQEWQQSTIRKTEYKKNYFSSQLSEFQTRILKQFQELSKHIKQGRDYLGQRLNQYLEARRSSFTTHVPPPTGVSGIWEKLDVPPESFFGRMTLAT